MPLPIAPTSSRTKVRQQSSHASLSRVAVSTSSSRSGHLDAVITPASRGAAALDGAVRLTARLDSTLVVLCSQNTTAAEVVVRFATVLGRRLLAIDVPEGYRYELMPTRTGAEPFRDVSGGRTSDLSVKRNLGLLLARLHGWGKILFLDDDIGERRYGRAIGLPVRTVRQMTRALDVCQIAGLACREFPDNSVVCHARRLVGLEQDTFISGAALGVNCHDHPLPFFPDLYNEDWFFFSRRVAARDIIHLGYARHAAYDPFQDPERARQEEFGDLLAEGLFALFAHQSPEMEYRARIDAAHHRYWEQFIIARCHILTTTETKLKIALEGRRGDPRMQRAAMKSLGTAMAQLSRLSPQLCVDYLAAWADDLAEWERATQRIRGVSGTPEAMDRLGLQRWWGDDRVS